MDSLVLARLLLRFGSGPDYEPIVLKVNTKTMWNLHQSRVARGSFGTCVHGSVYDVSVGPPRFRSTTGIAADLTYVLRSLTLTCMLSLDRDRQIVMSVGSWRQLAPGHLRMMHFSDLSSETPLKRALKRLKDRGYLAPIERRMVGGNGAGSGQYVYQLGREGWKLYGRTGQYWKYRAIDYHTLTIADAYLELLELERDGLIEILHHVEEPDTTRVVGGVEVRPDLSVEIGDINRGKRVSLWLEIDMGTEREAKIRQKLADYWRAYQNATTEEVRVFPRVVFLAPDVDRERWLRYIIEHGPKDAQDLFLVSTVSQYGRLLFA